MDDSYQFASFRDPSGFLFYQDGVLYRQVNLTYREHYDHLMTSGLYEALIHQGLMVAHTECDDVTPINEDLGISHHPAGKGGLHFLSL